MRIWAAPGLLKIDARITGRRVVLATFGSLGDLNPYVGLALELKARGHRPVIATSDTYRQTLADLGIEFHAVRPSLPSYREPDKLGPIVARCMDQKRGTAEIFASLLLPYLRESFDDLSRIAGAADLLVTHPLSLAGPIVAQKTEIPWVSTVLAPLSLFSAYDPPVGARMPGLQKILALHPLVARMFLWLLGLALTPMSRPVHKLRAELGLPRGKNPILEGLHSPTLVLGLFSCLLAQPQPDWPPRMRVTGFPFFDGRDPTSDGSEDSDELMRFLTTGEPPIVFTLGSAAMWVAKDFYDESTTAAQRLGQRALLLTGNARNRPKEPLPEGMAAFQYGPYGEVFPHARLIVHQGGIGTTGQALRAGKPMLVVPFAHDQYDNAARITRLGIGRTLPRSRYRAPRILPELEALLAQDSYAAHATEASARVQRENGAGSACDAIEELFRAPPLPTISQI